MHTAHLNCVGLLYPFRKVPLRNQIEHLAKYRGFPTRQGGCQTRLEFYGLDAGCPVSIEPHKSHALFIPQSVLEELREESIKPQIMVMAQDALWRNRYSKPFNYGEGVKLPDVTQA